MHRDAEHATFKFYVVYLMQAYTSPSAHLEFRRRSRIGSLLLPYRTQGSNSVFSPVQKTLYLLSYLASAEYIIEDTHSTISRYKTPAQICAFPSTVSHYLVYVRLNKGVTQNVCYVKLGEKPGSILEKVRQLKTRKIWNSKRWVYEWALSGKNHRNRALESAMRLGNKQQWGNHRSSALESAGRLGNGRGAQS